MRAAIVIQLIVSVTTAVATWNVWARRGPLEGKLAFLITAGALATPYLFNYDLPFLIIPVLWLYSAMAADGFRGWDRTILTFLYVAPFLSRVVALPLRFNFMPLVLLLMLWLQWSRLRPGGVTVPDLE